MDLASKTWVKTTEQHGKSFAEDEGRVMATPKSKVTFVEEERATGGAAKSGKNVAGGSAKSGSTLATPSPVKTSTATCSKCYCVTCKCSHAVSQATALGGTKSSKALAGNAGSVKSGSTAAASGKITATCRKCFCVTCACTTPNRPSQVTALADSTKMRAIGGFEKSSSTVAGGDSKSSNPSAHREIAKSSSKVAGNGSVSKSSNTVAGVDAKASSPSAIGWVATKSSTVAGNGLVSKSSSSTAGGADSKPVADNGGGSKSSRIGAASAGNAKSPSNVAGRPVTATCIKCYCVTCRCADAAKNQATGSTSHLSDATKNKAASGAVAGLDAAGKGADVATGVIVEQNDAARGRNSLSLDATKKSAASGVAVALDAVEKSAGKVAGVTAEKSGSARGVGTGADAAKKASSGAASGAGTAKNAATGGTSSLSDAAKEEAASVAAAGVDAAQNGAGAAGMRAQKNVAASSIGIGADAAKSASVGGAAGARTGPSLNKALTKGAASGAATNAFAAKKGAADRRLKEIEKMMLQRGAELEGAPYGATTEWFKNFEADGPRHSLLAFGAASGAFKTRSGGDKLGRDLVVDFDFSYASEDFGSDEENWPSLGSLEGWKKADRDAHPESWVMYRVPQNEDEWAYFNTKTRATAWDLPDGAHPYVQEMLPQSSRAFIFYIVGRFGSATRAFTEICKCASHLRPRGVAALTAGAFMDHEDFYEACVGLHLVDSSSWSPNPERVLCREIFDGIDLDAHTHGSGKDSLLTITDFQHALEKYYKIVKGAVFEQSDDSPPHPNDIVIGRKTPIALSLFCPELVPSALSLAEDDPRHLGYPDEPEWVPSMADRNRLRNRQKMRWAKSLGGGDNLGSQLWS